MSQPPLQVRNTLVRSFKAKCTESAKAGFDTISWERLAWPDEIMFQWDKKSVTRIDFTFRTLSQALQGLIQQRIPKGWWERTGLSARRCGLHSCLGHVHPMEPQVVSEPSLFSDGPQALELNIKIIICHFLYHTPKIFFETGPWGTQTSLELTL